jgi:hypothetical protein
MLFKHHPEPFTFHLPPKDIPYFKTSDGERSAQTNSEGVCHKAQML